MNSNIVACDHLAWLKFAKSLRWPSPPARKQRPIGFVVSDDKPG